MEFMKSSVESARWSNVFDADNEMQFSLLKAIQWRTPAFLTPLPDVTIILIATYSHRVPAV